MAQFNDPRVQKVYEILCADDDDVPSEEQHWEGWVARRIVDALYTAQPSATPTNPETLAHLLELAETWATECEQDAVNECATTEPTAKAYAAFESALRAALAAPQAEPSHRPSREWYRAKIADTPEADDQAMLPSAPPSAAQGIISRIASVLKRLAHGRDKV